MLDAIYWAAAGFALLGALFRIRLRLPAERATWALLASAGFYLVTQWTGLSFDLALWIAVDVAVCLVIAWQMLPLVRGRAWPWLAAYRKELAILVLFPLMWAAYLLPDEPGYVFTSIASTAQLLLTLPLRVLWARGKHASVLPKRWNEFDLRVRV